MLNERFARACLTIACALAVASIGHAKKTKVTSKQLLKEAKEAIEKVQDSSEPKVRAAVFEAKIALARKSAPVISEGLKSGVLEVKRRAVTAALGTKSKKLIQEAVNAIGQLLCSEASEDVAAGQSLRLRIGSKKTRDTLDAKVVDCPGSGLALEAKGSLIKRGGAAAWVLIERDLKDESDLPKRKVAFGLARAAKSKSAASWAMKRINDENELGELARDMMIGLAGTRLGRSYVPQLTREYRRAKKADDFETRLRLAMLLGNLGGVKNVQDTLFAAFSPNYKAPEGIVNTQERAWKGLGNVRSFKVLDRDISKSHKLKVRDLFCTVKTEAEATAAFDWLYAWTRKSQSKKLYAILEGCFKSDHKFARIAAIRVLAKLGNRASLPTFEAALNESNQEIRLAGARGIAAVAKKGDEERLGKLLQREKDEEGKLALIAGLRRIGTEESVAPLKFMVFRQPKRVTLAVVEALAARKDPSIAKNIASLKSSSDPEIRMTVWKHLLSLAPSEYTGSFVNVANAWVQPRHVVALSKIKAIPLDLFAELASKASVGVSHQAMRVLIGAGDKGASHILSVIDEHKDPIVASQALEILGAKRKKASLEYYVKLLKHPHAEVRARAAGLVALYGSKRKHLELVMGNRGDTDVAAGIAAHLAAYRLSRKRR